MAMISTQTMGDTEERLGVQQPQTKIVTGSVVAPSKQSESTGGILVVSKLAISRSHLFKRGATRFFRATTFAKKKLQQNQGHHVKGLETRIYEHQRY